MKDLLCELRGSLGRDLTDRETKALKQLVAKYGTPGKIEASNPWFNRDTRRAVILSWVVDGQEAALSLAPSPSPAKPRDLVQEHLDEYRKRGGRVVSKRRRIDLGGRCRYTIDRGAGIHVAPRARGAGRPKAQSTRSSAKSGDSGSEDGEPEPPQDGRRCACGCDLPLTGLRPQALYLNDAHRKRAQRQRDRLNPDRPAERRLLRLVEERPPAPIRCKCAPRRDLVDEGVCVQCGRPRGAVAVAWLNQARDVRSKQLVARAPARRNPRYGDRKRKRVREYIDREAVAA
jgi:hypothetical protein